MKTQEFRVMEWLRKIRDDHSEFVKNSTWKEIQKENEAASEKMKAKIKKQKVTQSL